ncbi:MAG: hypothetical protein ACR2P5_01770 [Gammaproteobacteria bacterium]
MIPIRYPRPCTPALGRIPAASPPPFGACGGIAANRKPPDSPSPPSFLRKQESRVFNFCRKAKQGEGKYLTAANDTGFLLSQE